MERYRRSAQGVIAMSARLLAVLLAAVLLAAIAPATAFAALDDAAPGLPLPVSPVHGTLLSPVSDVEDWYGVTLAEGDQLTLSLRGAAGTDFSLALYYAGTGVGEGDELFWLWFWEPGYPKETSYVVPEGAAGDYYVRIRAIDGQGSAGGYSLTWSKTHDVTARLYGLDRYQTAAAISRSSFESATAAVIASGENYPDALAASGLAGVLRAPVLLTRKDVVPEVVMRELQRLGVSKVYIIGSEAVVSLAAETMLSADPPDGAAYQVDRLAGDDRFQTAQRVAERIALLGGSSEAFLVSGRTYADALAVAPIAYARRMPVLLTEPGALSPAAGAALASLDTTHVVVAGSTAAVASVVASAADLASAANDTGDGHALERWDGATRYSTAVSVAQHAAALGWADWGAVGLATGKNFPDALGGGAALGAKGGVLLLTEPWTLTAVTGEALHAKRSSVGRVFLLGSTSALKDAVRSGVVSRLQ